MYQIEPIPEDIYETRKEKIKELTKNPATAYLYGNRIIILDPDSGYRLYDKLYFGKPFGIRKPKPIKYTTIYELSFYDAIYLLQRRALQIIDNHGKKVNFNHLWDLATKAISSFESKYKVYEDLREKGFVVKSGLKYGADFVVYVYGPGIDHSPFVVSVFGNQNKLLGLDFLKSGRLSWSVRKRWVLACVIQDTIKYFVFEWNKTLSL